MPVGQTATQRPQSTQAPLSSARPRRRSRHGLCDRFSAGLAAGCVVANDQRIVVDEDRLEAPVRADDEAEEGLGVGRRVCADHLKEFRDRDEVRDEDVRDEGRQHDPNRVEEDRPPAVRRRSVEALAALPVGDSAEDLLFERAKEPLKEDRLRAGPPTEGATEEGGRDDEGERHGEEKEDDERSILRIERRPKKEESAGWNVEKYSRIASDLDPREGDENRNKYREDELARRRKTPVDGERNNALTAPVGKDGTFAP
ncbi:hypothetical protein OUZ56_032486 [Daphnia magna]|uniref:Uncharacterized protein n=1 Tax=Daphnia magna TaxID=35525 RepID=A0ABR0B928_9CRUS|nr:hypothetical protein OUZ56_032486 [Daphnia magna]